MIRTDLTRFSRVVLTVAAVTLCLGLASACSPKVGSKEWCDALKNKPKGDWTANEAAEFAKSCILK